MGLNDGALRALSAATMASGVDEVMATMSRKYPTRTVTSQARRRRAWGVLSTLTLWGWAAEPAKRAAPEKARRGPARVRMSLVDAGAGPARWRSSPMTDARRGD